METDYEISFSLILNAGNSKNYSQQAVEQARDGNFDEAKELIKKSNEELNKAHHAQTSLIQDEARGNKVNVNIILVHAQDHLSSAMIIRDQAEEFIAVYQSIYEIKERLK